MASREFTDSEGVVWRVWDVTPAHLHPVTRAEEYMEPYAGGWLTFESPFEKRRMPIDILCGTDAIRKAIERGTPLPAIERAWQRDLERWKRRRASYLMY